jgi:hypothetical protein
MLISINRKIFLALPKELQGTYVYENVCSSSNELPSYEDEAKISKHITEIIITNEKFHEKYGVIQKNLMKQVDETCEVPGFSEPTGYYQVGKLLIAPFDWSWDDNGDFDYSFNLYYSLEHCKEIQ